LTNGSECAKIEKLSQDRGHLNKRIGKRKEEEKQTDFERKREGERFERTEGT